MDWKTAYQQKIVSAADAVKCVKSGDTVVVQQAAGTATYLLDALTDRADELENVKIIGHNLWETPRFLQPQYAKSFRHIRPIGRAGWTRCRPSIVRCPSTTVSIRQMCSLSC